MKTEKCNICDTKYFGQHTDLECAQVQLGAAHAEIKKLKISVDAWKDSWYYQREIIGRLAWQNNLDIRNSYLKKEKTNDNCKEDGEKINEEISISQDGEETSPSA